MLKSTVSRRDFSDISFAKNFPRILQEISLYFFLPNWREFSSSALRLPTFSLLRTMNFGRSVFPSSRECLQWKIYLHKFVQLLSILRKWTGTNEEFEARWQFASTWKFMWKRSPVCACVSYSVWRNKKKIGKYDPRIEREVLRVFNFRNEILQCR